VVLSKGEVFTLFSCTPNLKHRTVLMTLYATGVRVSELTRLRVKDILALRGGYVEDWTVFWITAQFLNAAAQFHELGVPIWN